jgi:tRNA threonylcarbamoyladenosine biosynthesis protein TsaE
MTIFSHSEKQTEEAGRRLAGRLSPGAVVALYGGLGAGKTAFVRGLSEGLGIGACVSSPTFTIVNEYPGNVPLFHFDMYRLSGEDELYDIGWDEYLERGGIIAVEWSEIVPNALPEDAVRVVISHTEDGGRRIDIELPEAQK